MRIKNKYIRNRSFRLKYWKHIRSKSQPYETLCPYRIDIAPRSYWVKLWDTEEQIKRHFEWITEQARRLENGSHRSTWHAPKSYRKVLNDKRKAAERNYISKIRQGNYDALEPKFKKDADWFYF